MIDGDRPVYPTIAVIGVRESGCAEGSEVLSSLKPREQLLRSSILKATSNLGCLPSEIIVGSPIAELALTDLCQRKNITLTPSESMPLFSDIANSLAKSPFFQNDDLEDSPLSQITSEDAQKIDDLMRAMPANASPREAKAFINKLSSLPGADVLLESFVKQFEEEEEIIGRSPEKKPPQNLPAYPHPKSTTRLVFRVDLVGAKPPIWRRISVPDDASFFDLHLSIQAAFDWAGYHLHSFEFRNQGRHPSLVIDWLGEEGEMAPMMRGQRAKEYEILIGPFIHNNQISSFNYVYDFGDYWDHKIKLENTVTSEDSSDMPIVEVLKGKSAFPVEDCGGIHGLMALINDDHPALPDFFGSRTSR